MNYDDEDERDDIERQPMKAIKTLVIFMGVLLVAGLGMLGYGLMSKAGHKAAHTQAPAPAAAAGFGTVTVPLPAGARVESIVQAGERVVLRVTGGGGERVIVLDPATGQVAGSFVLAPEPPQR
jgi:hypothetical protein